MGVSFNESESFAPPVENNPSTTAERSVAGRFENISKEAIERVKQKPYFRNVAYIF